MRVKNPEELTKKERQRANALRYLAKPGVKEKRAEVMRAHADKNKERIENCRLIRTYGISLKDYNSLFILQKGCCAICGEHQLTMKNKLVVDHNHETGEIRGLLCRPCNMGIGLLKDKTEVLLNAAKYLASYFEG